MIGFRKSQWPFLIFLVLTLFIAIISASKEIETQLLQPQNNEIAVRMKPDFSMLFKKQHIAALILPYLVDKPFLNPKYIPLLDPIAVQERLARYSYTYLFLYHYLFTPTKFTDKEFDSHLEIERSTAYFTKVIRPLLLSPDHADSWITFFAKEFANLLKVTAEQETRSVACFRKLYFYHVLIEGLDERKNKDKRYKRLYKKLQKIIYNHLQEFNSWEQEYLFGLFEQNANSRLFITRRTLNQETAIQLRSKGKYRFISTKIALRLTRIGAIKYGLFQVLKIFFWIVFGPALFIIVVYFVLALSFFLSSFTSNLSCASVSYFPVSFIYM